MPSSTDLELPYLAMGTPEFATDPFPHFEAARARHPWLATSDFGLVVTEYAAMKDLLGLNESLRTANDGVAEIMGAQDSRWGRFAKRNIFNQQGETHRRMRDAIAPIFTPRHANQIREVVRETIADLLDQWVPRGEFDFEEFASYFPISVLSRMIGGPVSAVPGLRSTLETAGLAFALDRTLLPQIDAAQARVEEFVEALVAERRDRGPQGDDPDLLDLLIGASDEGKLSEGEAIDLIVFMYVGGYDSTKGVLTFLMRHLIDRPDMYRRCAEDAEYCRKVVEEMLRFSGVSTSFRVATADVDYRDVTIPKGAMLFFPVSVAGRDPGTFPNPDSFDPDRPIDPQHRHIAFGRGVHVCIGQHIARVLLQEGLHLIAQRVREPELAGDHGWRRFPGIWGIKSLPISFTPA